MAMATPCTSDESHLEGLGAKGAGDACLFSAATQMSVRDRRQGLDSSSVTPWASDALSVAAAAALAASRRAAAAMAMAAVARHEEACTDASDSSNDVSPVDTLASSVALVTVPSAPCLLALALVYSRLVVVSKVSKKAPLRAWARENTSRHHTTHRSWEVARLRAVAAVPLFSADVDWLVSCA